MLYIILSVGVAAYYSKPTFVKGGLCIAQELREYLFEIRSSSGEQYPKMPLPVSAHPSASCKRP